MRGSAVLLGWDAERSKGRWVSGEGRRLAALRGRGDRSRGGGPSPGAEVGGRRLGKMVGRERLSSLDGLRRRSRGFGGGDVTLFPPPHACSCTRRSGSRLMLLVQERGNFGTPVALALFCRRETVSCNPLYCCDYIGKPQGNWFN